MKILSTCHVNVLENFARSFGAENRPSLTKFTFFYGTADEVEEASIDNALIDLFRALINNRSVDQAG